MSLRVYIFKKLALLIFRAFFLVRVDCSNLLLLHFFQQLYTNYLHRYQFVTCSNVIVHFYSFMFLCFNFPYQSYLFY